MSQHIGYTYFKAVNFLYLQVYCLASDNIFEKNPEVLVLAVNLNLGPKYPYTQDKAKKSKKSLFFVNRGLLDPRMEI